MSLFSVHSGLAYELVHTSDEQILQVDSILEEL